MTFSEALEEMKKRKRVASKLWMPPDHIFLQKNKFIGQTYMGRSEGEYRLSYEEIMSDWEIVP